MRNYTRWRASEDDRLYADILGAPYTLSANPPDGLVELLVPVQELVLNPDEARMLGVRLIEAGALADGPRAIREAGS